MAEDFKLDKAAFSMGTFKQASHQLSYWKTKPLSKRLEAAWMLMGLIPTILPKWIRLISACENMTVNGKHF